MKEKIISEIVQQMLPYLDNYQLGKLNKVVEQVFCCFDVVYVEKEPELDYGNDLITKFIAANRGLFRKNPFLLSDYN